MNIRAARWATTLLPIVATVLLSPDASGQTACTGVSPVANIDFAECTASPGAAITHWSVGTGVANQMIGAGAISPSITVAVGVIPRIKTTSTITLD